MKIINLAPMIPNNDNFTMHASVSNVSIIQCLLYETRENQWMCDIYTNATFNNFVEVCIREITKQSKIQIK